MARYLRSFVGIVQHLSNHSYSPEEYCIYSARPNGAFPNGILCFGSIESLVGFIAKRYGNDFRKHIKYSPPKKTEAVVFGIGSCYNRFHRLGLEERAQFEEDILKALKK